MSHVVVVGVGVPTLIDAVRHFGPGRRTAHFASALADAGHQVTALWAADASAETLATGVAVPFVTSAGAHGEVMGVSDRDFVNGRAQRLLRELAPDAVVGATVHGAVRLARVIERRVPLWADVFGDPMAEAQVKAAADGNDLALPRYWESFAAVLERADRLSAVSSAQALALVGQLGLAGRLTAEVAGRNLVSVIPCAAQRHPAPAMPWVRGAVVPESAFIALFNGSFNTWCDIPTLVLGVELAMDLAPTLHLVTTGGGIPGHDERCYGEFVQRVASSRHRDRFHVEGWISADRLAALYEEANLGLNIEKRVHERLLGAENRVVDWMAYGVPAITTSQSEMGRFLVARKLAFAVSAADPAGLARVLAELASEPARVRAAGAACREHADSELGYATTAAPLLDWCDHPDSASASARPLRLALASEPGSLAGLLEDYLAEMGNLELACRSVRWLWRRIGRRRAIRHRSV